MKKLDRDKIAAFIIEAPIGQYIGESGAHIFAQRAHSIVDIKKGEYLFKKGQKTGNFHILLGGRLAMVSSKKDNNKEAKIIHVLRKGDLIGELSFIDNTHHSTTIMALTESKAIQFNAKDIFPLIEQEPQLMFNFMRAVIRRVHHTLSSINKLQLELSNYIATGGKGKL